MSRPEPPVVLFDGVCNLCNASVRFILKRDRRGVFRFAPLQSAAGIRLTGAAEAQATGRGLDTMVLVEDGRRYTKSTAALRILRRLRWPWPMLYPLVVVPRFLRDAVYDRVSRNRYRWFGRRDACMVPRPEWRHRFLD